MALVKTVEMRVLAKSGDAQAKLDELAAEADKLSSDGIRMRFRVDDAEGKAQLDDIKAKADLLGFKDVSIKVKVDGAGRAIADLMAVKHEADAAGGGGGGLLGKLFSGAGGGILSAGESLPIVGGLGPAAIPALVGGLAALVPEIVAVGSGFAAAGAGAGAFALLAMPAIKQVTSAYEALNTANQKYKAAVAKEAMDPSKANKSAVQAAMVNSNLALEAMAKLPLSEQTAAQGVQKLTGELGKMSRAFAPQAFLVFADGLKVINNLLPHLTPFANTFAQGLDKLLQQANKFTQSKGFTDWLKQFHSLEGPAIAAIGHGIGEVANSFGKLMTVMSGKDVGHAINIAFGALSGTISAVAASVRFLMTAWDGMGLAIGNVKGALHGVANAFDTIRHGLADSAHSWAATFDGLRHAAATAAHNVAHAFDNVRHDIAAKFDGIKAAVVGKFAGAAGWLLSAGKAIIQGLINGIESMLGPLEAVASKVAGVVKKVAGFLGIHSPSTVMHGYGVNIIEGLMLGMNSRLPALEKVAAKAGKIIADRIKTEISYAKGVASATVQGLGLTSIDLSQGNVATGMQSYLASIKAFIGEIKALTSQHLNKGILQQLIAAGPVTGGQYATSILQGGVGQVNSLYKQIQHQSALLGAQAAMSVYGGKAAPKGDTYTITVQGGLITDKQALAMEIVKVLREYKRHTHVPLGLG